MKRYLLDSGPLAAYLRGRPAAHALLYHWVRDLEVVTSELCYGEVVEYVMGLPNSLRYRADFRLLMQVIHPYPLSLPIMDRYADLRRQLRPPNGPGLIGDIDTLIAATAIEHDLVLIATDSDFRRVPGLKLNVVSQLR